MSDYIKLFDSKTQQDNFAESEDYIQPHISCTKGGGNLKYNNGSGGITADSITPDDLVKYYTQGRYSTIEDVPELTLNIETADTGDLVIDEVYVGHKDLGCSITDAFMNISGSLRALEESGVLQSGNYVTMGGKLYEIVECQGLIQAENLYMQMVPVGYDNLIITIEQKEQERVSISYISVYINCKK